MKLHEFIKAQKEKLDRFHSDYLSKREQNLHGDASDAEAWPLDMSEVEWAEQFELWHQ